MNKNYSHSHSSRRAPSLVWAYISGRLRLYGQIRSQIFYYLCLQVFTLCLAIASGFLGYTRSLTFFESFQNAQVLALIVTVFVAFFVYAFVSHTMSRLGYLLCGGKLSRSAVFGLVISFLLMGSMISLDLYLNYTSIEPIVVEYTIEKESVSVDSIRQHFDSLITDHEVDIEDMVERYFTYKGRVSVPSEPNKWISQSVLDQYQLLIDEKASLISQRDTAIMQAYVENTQASGYTEREKDRKIELFSFAVYIIYIFMILASLRAGMYAQQVALLLGGEVDQKTPEVIEPEPLGEVSKPAYILPLRNVDKEKYQNFLKYAKRVHAERGRYVKSEIARRSGVARETVKHYLHQAINKGDLIKPNHHKDPSSKEE